MTILICFLFALNDIKCKLALGNNATVPPNAPYVIYTDSNGQLLDTLPVCQDFNRSMCSRLNCRFVHLMESDKVEVCDQRVAVCRDHANGQCKRKQCKYYHIPIVLPPANVMATIYKTQHPQLVNTNTNNGCITSSNNISNTITTTNSNNNCNPNNDCNHKSENINMNKSATMTATAPSMTLSTAALMSSSQAPPPSLPLHSMLSSVESSVISSASPSTTLSQPTMSAAGGSLLQVKPTMISASIPQMVGTVATPIDVSDVSTTSRCIQNLFINAHHKNNNKNSHNSDSTAANKNDSFVNLIAVNNSNMIGMTSASHSLTNTLFPINTISSSNNSDCNSNFITFSVPPATVPCNNANGVNINNPTTAAGNGTSMYLL